MNKTETHGGGLSWPPPWASIGSPPRKRRCGRTMRCGRRGRMLSAPTEDWARESAKSPNGWLPSSTQNDGVTLEYCNVRGDVGADIIRPMTLARRGAIALTGRGPGRGPGNSHRFDCMECFLPPADSPEHAHVRQTIRPQNVVRAGFYPARTPGRSRLGARPWLGRMVPRTQNGPILQARPVSVPQKSMISSIPHSVKNTIG